ncbi:MAG: InlB B-repeat-containing protein [Tannerella sp.]|nr:InlB B-repeat-containing protein [Tannerella sp.]
MNFTSATFSETEGNNTHETNSVKIRVSGGTLAQPQVVNFTCANGTAAHATDYTYVKGFTIPAGNYATPQELTLDNIFIVGNTACQNNRTFTVSIDAVDNCNDLVVRGMTINSTTVTIVDDEQRPELTTSLTNITVFAGQTVPAITLAATPAGATFAWTNSNPSIGLAASGTGNLPAFMATNTTAAAITATVRVTPTIDCAGTTKEYTITVKPKPKIMYHYNGGTAPATANPTDYVVGTAFSISNAPTRTGYTFAGWTCSDINVTTPANPLNVPATASVDLNVYASWGAIPYSIAYTPNGGEVPLPNPNPSTYDVETPNFTLKNPVKRGYIFSGWTGSNGTTAQTVVTVTTGTTGNLNYTANWSVIPYNISYNLDDGVAGLPTNLTTYTVENGAILLSNPTKNGYSFVGWTGTDVLTPTVNVTIPAASIGDRNFTAHWTLDSYPITYDWNSGTPVSNPSEYYVTSEPITLNNPTRTGYTFNGWTGYNGTIPQTSVTIPAGSTGARNYKANWTRIVYTLSYTLATPNGNGNGTVSTPNPTTYHVDTTVITLTNPTHPGYTFKGWSSDYLTGEDNLTATIPAGSTGNHSFTAHWVLLPVNNFPITYTLTTPSTPELITTPANPASYNIEMGPIVLQPPSHPGYTFKGWTGSNGTIPQTSVTIPTGSTGARDFTANWELQPGVNDFTIGYNLNGGTVVGTNPTSYNVESSPIILINPTKTGWTFNGWTGSNGTTPQTSVTIPTGSIGPRTYTANWIVLPTDAYPITYTRTSPTHSEMITENPTNPVEYFVNSPEITLTNLTHPGYTFKGWTGTGVGTPSTNVKISTGSTGARSYTANWALESSNNFTIDYTLTPPSMPGLVVVNPANPMSYNIETGTITLTKPTHPGYTFTGWTGSNGTTPELTVTIPNGSTGNRAYVAHWVLDPALNTFDLSYTLTTPNGSSGTVTTSNPSTYTVETTTFALNNPTHPGYTFIGWTGTDVNSASTNVQITKGSTGNRSYTANWSAPLTFTIGYDLDGGSVAAPTNPTAYTVVTPSFILKNPTKTGWTFKGWTGDNGPTPETSVSISTGSTGDKNYTANWEVLEANAYTISYTLTTPNNESGTVTPPNPVKYFVNSSTFELNKPTHPGYTFKGWTGSNGGSPQTSVSIATGSTGAKNYTANWAIEAANNFAINYTLAPPSMPGLVVVNPANPTSYHIETTTITLTKPTHPGYTFTGWTGDNGTTPELTVTIPKGSTGPRSYTANWTLSAANVFPIGYTLTTPTTPELVVDPGNPATYDIETTTFGLAPPTHPGYTFKGWTGDNGSTPQTSVSISKGSTGAKNYVANWAIESSNNFSITYTLTPPSMPGLVVVSPPNPASYNIETNTITLTNPTHPGYTFTGWTGSNGTTPELIVEISKGSYGNRAYTANWELNATNSFAISYDLHTPNGQQGTVAAPGNPSSYNIQTPVIELIPPTHPGYTFTGWTGDNGLSPLIPVTIPLGSTGDKSYVANWSLNTFTITYDYAGGTAVNDVNYTTETPEFYLNTPTRPGYTFTGWSGDAATGLNGNANMTVAIPLGSYGNRTYTAHWSLNAYPIVFDPNGGALPLAIPLIWQGYNMESMPTGIDIVPTRLGYTFKGWTGHGLSGEMSPFAITAGMTGVPGPLTFVAEWAINDYTISYDYYVPGNPLTYNITNFPVVVSEAPSHLDPRYVFVGWSSPELPAVPKQLVYNIPAGTLSNLNFVANWAKPLDVLNGGTGDSLYVCSSPRTLYGDPQAQGWTWILPDGSQQTTRGISANVSGRYICRADYGTTVVPDTLHVYFLVDANTRIDYITTTGAKIGKPLQFVLRLPDEILSKATVSWSLPDGGSIVSAASDTLTAMWNTTGEKHISVSLVLNYGGVDCSKTVAATVKITERGLGFFVDQAVAGGAHDGSSWADAYSTIEEALSTATPGDRIWVARGTYRPDPGRGSFMMKQDSVEIYGGFNATEEYLYERNPQSRPTVMLGDGIHPVVTVEGCAGIRIDGFTIENGRADRGAGIRLTGGSTGTLANSIIRRNAATSQGGGIFASAPWYGYDGPVLINTEISGNRAATGGGIYSEGSSLQMLNATVSGNSASEAGGLYSAGSSPVIRNTVIWGNVATRSDGAAVNVTNAGGTPQYANSLIGGSGGSGSHWVRTLGIDGGGNRDVNPLFLYAGVENDGETLRDGNYRLSGNSAAVDAGNNFFVLRNIFTPWDIWLLDPRVSTVEKLPMDLDFNMRIADDDAVDMGAYEYNSAALPMASIDREVILPSVEGVITEPGAGSHYVRSRDNFVFRVIPSARYAGEELVVTTSRTRLSDREGVKTEKNADGSYNVTVYAVQDRTNVFISFGWDINADTGMTAGSKVWAYGSELHVLAAEDGMTLRVYSLAGQMLRQRPLPKGETVMTLPQGVYAVSIDDSGMMGKVIIR